MATLTKTKRNIPASFYPLALLSLMGVGLSIYRLVVGLGPTTNLTDHFPWGLWITLDVFIIPVAGAAFTVSLISYFFMRETCHEIIRPAVLAGFLGYSVVGLFLLVDIGRWPQFYNVLVPGYINIHSFLEEIALCVTLYTGILAIEVAPVFLEKWNITAPTKWIKRLILIIAGAGIVLSTLHQSSIGSMFILLSHKLHAIWWTPALPLLFFTQAVFSGLGTAGIAVFLTWRGLKLPMNRLLFYRMALYLRALLVAYLVFKFGDWLLAGELGLLFSSGEYSVLIWVELALGAFVPLAILLSRLSKRPVGTFWASVFIVMGLFLNRLIVSWVGLSVPAWAVYTPSWTEVLISVGFIAGVVLIYGAVARWFELFPEEH